MGKTAKELVDDFHTAMDDYLTLCEDEGVKSEAAYKGSFHIRISTDRTEQKTTLLGQKSGFASFLYDFRKDRDIGV